MAENKMAEVAQLFGKKLGERFKIKDLATDKVYVAFFDSYGMRTRSDGFPNSWGALSSRDMVMQLIVGEAVIIDE